MGDIETLLGDKSLDIEDKGCLHYTKGDMMPQGYEPYPKDWWTDRRIELYRLFSEGHNIAFMKKMLDENGKRIFPGNKELSSVKAAFEHHDDPFAKPNPLGDTGGDGSGDSADGKQRNTPQLRGPSLVGTVRPRMLPLDPKLFILYDLTKRVFPDYDRDMGEWISESVMGFYSDHSDELELGRLFTQAEEVEDDNRERTEPSRSSQEAEIEP